MCTQDLHAHQLSAEMFIGPDNCLGQRIIHTHQALDIKFM